MRKDKTRPTMKDVGNIITLEFQDEIHSRYIGDVFVAMGIKAPNGETCFIFGQERDTPARWKTVQSKAIKAFMKQHNQ